MITKTMRAILIGALVCVPIVAGAGAYRAVRSTVMHIPASQTRTENVYLAGEKIAVDGTLKKDLVVAAQEIRTSGVIAGDMLAAGETALVEGPVAGDVRIGVAESMISSAIDGDLLVFGGKMFIAEGAVVRGATTLLVGTARVNGTLAGPIRISAGELYIDGLISGAGVLEAGRLTFGPHAVVDGELTYRGPRDPIIMAGATIGKGFSVVRDDFGGRDARLAFAGMRMGFIVLMLIASILLSFLMYRFFRHQSLALMHEALGRWWPQVGHGALLFIAFPVASLLIIGTIVGLPVGVLGLCVWGALLILAQGLGGIIGATWVMRAILRRGESYQLSSGSLIVGVLIVRLFGAIPVAGWIFSMVLLFASFGVIGRAAYHQIRKMG